LILVSEKTINMLEKTPPATKTFQMNLKQPFHCLNHWRRKLFEEESLEII
jgi:hypothetical protein